MSPLWSVAPGQVDHRPFKREVKYNSEVESKRRKRLKAIGREQRALQKGQPKENKLLALLLGLKGNQS
jgi:hypothetical protein